MAGGMGRGDEGLPRETLAERLAVTRARQDGLGHGTAGFHGAPPNASSAWTATPPTAPTPAAPSPVSPPSASPAEPVRPCWYEAPWGRQPALLLQWRRSEDGGYLGLVVVAAPDETGSGWTVVRLWADSSLLAPG